MISVPDSVKDLINKNPTLKMNVGATIDINVNSMVEFTDSSITGNEYAVINNRQPFKKLFPIDTIIKPMRPISAGVKYGIVGDIPNQTYTDPTTVNYKPSGQASNTVKYRTYYPGIDTYYKYWVSPKNANAAINIAYPKTVYANKVVVTFEISHAMPSAWTVTIGDSTISGTSADIKNFNSINYDAGSLTLYYNGTAWSKNAADLNLSSYKSFTTASLVATNPGGYIGVIEFAPHWVRDLTSYIVDMDIRKESSASTESLVPVGNITANSMSMSLNNFSGKVDSGTMFFQTYTKSTTIDTSKMYLYKQAQINVYFKLYDSTGPLTDSKGKYHKINQGLFYLDSWDVSEFGDVSLQTLDASKILQETLAPDILCESYSSIAIVRRLLDAVGFTNYNFNYNESDKSIISPNYWWSDYTTTVWDNLQILCRDAQMSAVMDENNVLQFYTRDYIYDKSRSINHTLRSKTSVDGLANIMSLTKKDLPSANQIRVIFYSVTSSSYEQNSATLWSSGNSYLAAAALKSNLLVTDIPTTNSKKYVTLDPITVNELSGEQIIYSFNGYLLIDSEVVEYDAIEYQYIDVDTAQDVKIDITGDSDLLKNRGRARIASTPGGELYKTTFIPTGRYRIKTRGAFGTKIASHLVNPKNDALGWSGYKGVIWK
jgi:hypothetical protein